MSLVDGESEATLEFRLHPGKVSRVRHLQHLDLDEAVHGAEVGEVIGVKNRSRGESGGSQNTGVCVDSLTCTVTRGLSAFVSCEAVSGTITSLEVSLSTEAKSARHWSPRV